MPTLLQEYTTGCEWNGLCCVDRGFRSCIVLGRVLGAALMLGKGVVRSRMVRRRERRRVVAVVAVVVVVAVAAVVGGRARRQVALLIAAAGKWA